MNETLLDGPSMMDEIDSDEAIFGTVTKLQKGK